MSDGEEVGSGVLVVGTCGSPLEHVARWIGEVCGVPVTITGPDQPGRPLGEMNELLLTRAGGSWMAPPKVSPRDLERALRPQRERARAVFSKSVSLTPPEGDRNGAASWVWADPRLSMLAPFWAEALGVSPLIVWCFATAPASVAEMTRRFGIDPATAGHLWDRYHRSALFATEAFEVLMLGDEVLCTRPDEALARTAGFFSDHGFQVNRRPWSPPAHDAARWDNADANDGDRDRMDLAALTDSPSNERTSESNDEDDALYSVLRELEENGFEATEPVTDATASFYDEGYYRTDYGDETGLAYSRDEPHWEQFFGRIAKELVDLLHPRTALDAGCAIGMLVEELRDRGVDAYGIDVSSWAIKQVPDDVRPYCSVGSILAPFPDHYDVITCIEVLEHLPPTMARPAVANLCAHSDAVLISSTADDVTERSHLNVNPPDYWARLFADQGFVREFSYDATYISPDSVLYRRRKLATPDAIAGYEILLHRASMETRQRAEELHAMLVSRDETEAQRLAACADHDRLAERLNALGVDHQQLTGRYSELELRRTAEIQTAGQEVELLERSQSKMAAELADQTARAEAASNELSALHSTKLFRYSRHLRRIYGRLRGGARPENGGEVPETLVAPAGGVGDPYRDWVERYDQFGAGEREALSARVHALVETPLVSVVLPVFNTPEPLLRRAIESVREQVYPGWELCIADDRSTDPTVATVLAEYEQTDRRIRVVHRKENGHISASSNSALEIAHGDWVIPMDHDDELRPNALAEIVLAIADHPDAGLLFSDEDKIDVEGRRHSPNFKPDFDPTLLLGQNYLGHLVCYRRDLVSRVGGYREGFEGSQDWDLSLRITELLDRDQVVHVPRVLYHWRSHTASTASGISAKPYARLAGQKAVEEHLGRVDSVGSVVTNPISGWHRVRWALPAPAPKVSIIVPTRDGRLLARCLDSLFQFTAYPNFEVVLVDNGSVGRTTLDVIRGREYLLKLIRDERPFNYSGLNDHAVERCDGEILCLLNDDCEVTTSDWLGEMVGQLLQERVGAVGAKLLYPDGRIQHAGVVLGFDGVAGHANRLADRLAPGHGGRLHVAHSVSAVTAACMVTRREAWEEVGGLDEHNLPIAFNDVDYCLRLQQAGWRVVWTPFAEMRHYESLTRGSDAGERAEGFARECAYMRERWGPLLRSDPAYNPNLGLWSDGGEFAFPPRIVRS
jgi:glycosyltransferase involved in cell wall biosynthesis